MVITRSSGSRLRQLLALAASVAVTLVLATGAVGGSMSASAADDPVPGVQGMLLGDRTLPAVGGSITQQVSYENLTPGLHYGVDVRFLTLSGAETDIEEVGNFTPTAPDGSLEVELVVPEGFQGKSLVAVLELYELSDVGAPIAVHHDLADPRQTVVVAAFPTPGVRGSLVNVSWLPSSGGTITERVAYDDLVVGHQYEILVEMRQQDGTATDISAVEDFIPIAPDGTIDIDIDVPAAAAGSTLVAFVSLYKPTVAGELVAVHHDLADPRQTVDVIGRPVVRGAIVGERWTPGAGWTLTDRVEYRNLTPGTRYSIFVEMRTPGGDFTDFGLVVPLRPAAPSGTLDVDIVVPTTWAGKTLIATIWLFEPDASGDPIATEDDLTNPRQTIVVRGAPDVRASLRDAADGDRLLPAAGGRAVDKVSYNQLIPGEEYTVTGVLMQASDATETPVTSSVTFTASATNGTTELNYEVPEGYAGEDLVSFLRVYAGTDTSADPIATDEQLDDPTQTVSVEALPVQPSTPPASSDPAIPVHQELAATGSESPALPLGLASAFLTIGLALVAARTLGNRRRRVIDQG